jgi:hypothetical protein
MFNCANDPANGKGHEDYTLSAAVNRSALGGNDAHAGDDICPRSVTPPGVIEPFQKILEKGCGTKKSDGTFGAPVTVDVVVKP